MIYAIIENIFKKETQCMYFKTLFTVSHHTTSHNLGYLKKNHIHRSHWNLIYDIKQYITSR